MIAPWFQQHRGVTLAELRIEFPLNNGSAWPVPARIQNTAILKAAREVFLRKGMAGTTKEIAKKAAVSEGILFARFKTPQGAVPQGHGAPRDGHSAKRSMLPRSCLGWIRASLPLLRTCLPTLRRSRRSPWRSSRIQNSGRRLCSRSPGEIRFLAYAARSGGTFTKKSDRDASPKWMKKLWPASLSSHFLALL